MNKVIPELKDISTIEIYDTGIALSKEDHKKFYMMLANGNFSDVIHIIQRDDTVEAIRNQDILRIAKNHPELGIKEMPSITAPIDPSNEYAVKAYAFHKYAEGRKLPVWERYKLYLTYYELESPEAKERRNQGKALPPNTEAGSAREIACAMAEISSKTVQCLQEIEAHTELDLIEEIQNGKSIASVYKRFKARQKDSPVAKPAARSTAKLTVKPVPRTSLSEAPEEISPEDIGELVRSVVYDCQLLEEKVSRIKMNKKMITELLDNDFSMHAIFRTYDDWALRAAGMLVRKVDRYRKYFQKYKRAQRAQRQNKKER